MQRLRGCVVPQARRRRLVEPHRIPRQPGFGKDDALRPVRKRVPDQRDGSLEAARQVEEDRRMLDDREPTVLCWHPAMLGQGDRLHAHQLRRHRGELERSGQAGADGDICSRAAFTTSGTGLQLAREAGEQPIDFVRAVVEVRRDAQAGTVLAAARGDAIRSFCRAPWPACWRRACPAGTTPRPRERSGIGRRPDLDARQLRQAGHQLRASARATASRSPRGRPWSGTPAPRGSAIIVASSRCPKPSNVLREADRAGIGAVDRRATACPARAC